MNRDLSKSCSWRHVPAVPSLPQQTCTSFCFVPGLVPEIGDVKMIQTHFSSPGAPQLVGGTEIHSCDQGQQRWRDRGLGAQKEGQNETVLDTLEKL